MLDFLIPYFDTSKPLALAAYVAALVLLVYQYLEVSIEVFGESAALHREIEADDKLRGRLSNNWQTSFSNSQHLFYLGGWFIVACVFLLILFLLLLYALNPPSLLNGNAAIAPVTPGATPPALPLNPAQLADAAARAARIEAQRLLGFGFVGFCVVAALSLKYAKYSAIRKMNDFSRETVNPTTPPPKGSVASP